MTDKTSPHPDTAARSENSDYPRATDGEKLTGGMRYDDSPFTIDWDEIHATTQPDFEAGRFAFDTDDYPTEEAAMAAMDTFIEGIIKEAERELAAQTPLHAARS